MGTLEDPFKPRPDGSANEETAQEVERKGDWRRLSASPLRTTASAAPAIARLHGFDLLEQPLLSGLRGRDGQLVAARSTVALKHGMRGREVLVVFADGDLDRPVITGVLQPGGAIAEPAPPAIAVSADGERQLISAEREIVLRCGDASITLTRAGKVLIQGAYISSRSTGYNKIKGAAIDIN